MRHKSATGRRTCLHSDRTHVTIVCVVAVGMMQADINAKIDLVILRIPPARVDDLISIRRGVNRTIRDAIVHAIMTIIKHPITEAVRPVSSTSYITNSSLWRRRAGRRGRRTVLIRNVASERQHAIIKCVVGSGMIKDGFL